MGPAIAKFTDFTSAIKLPLPLPLPLPVVAISM